MTLKLCVHSIPVHSIWVTTFAKYRKRLLYIHVIRGAKFLITTCMECVYVFFRQKYIVMFPFHAVTFDSDGCLTTKALSRLEQIGITILRELDAHRSPFRSVVGMDKIDLPIDNSFSLLEICI